MIPYLSVSELGLMASGLYSVLTLITAFHRDIPMWYCRAFFVATVFLLLISKNPFTTYMIDAHDAKEIAFAFAILAGVVGFGVAWYRGHFDCEDHSPVGGDPDDDSDDPERDT